MNRPNIDARIEGLALAGRSMWGDAWQTPLAAILGVTPAMLGHLAAGRRTLSDKLYADFLRAFPRIEAKLKGDIAERLALLDASRKKLGIEEQKVAVSVVQEEAKPEFDSLNPDEDGIGCLTDLT